MLTAEVFNWTGHVLMTPRTRLSAALKRAEARYTGIYLLFGEDDNGPLAYIGEGEDISARIKNHDTAKDWWASAVLITTAGNNLNKAHVKYLEARLIEEARRVGKGTENYAFKSPSAAAAVVNGRPANGTIEWKLQTTGQTYKEWEAEKLNQEG